MIYCKQYEIENFKQFYFYYSDTTKANLYILLELFSMNYIDIAQLI